MKKIKLLKPAIALIVTMIYTPVAFSAANLEAGVVELANEISKNMTKKSKKKIAVIEFSDLNDNINGLGQFLAEELITQLFIVNPGAFEVVERRQLAKVLRQQKLSTTGLLEPKAMESVGKILGVDAIVTGSTTDLGNTIKVNARIIDVNSAKIFAVASTNIPKTSNVVALLQQVQTVKTTGLQHEVLGNRKSNSFDLTGLWSGLVKEGNRSDYGVKMKIKQIEVGGRAGQITYFGGLDCGGFITYMGEKSATHIFNETIDAGTSSCASNGRIEVRKIDDAKIKWEYFRPNQSGKPTVYGILTKSL